MNFISTSFLVQICERFLHDDFRLVLLKPGVTIQKNTEKFNPKWEMEGSGYMSKRLRVGISPFEGGCGLTFEQVQWDVMSGEACGYCIYSSPTKRLVYVHFFDKPISIDQTRFRLIFGDKEDCPILFSNRELSYEEEDDDALRMEA